MNYKKGLFRLLIIGAILAPLVGLWNNATRYGDTRGGYNTFASAMVKELKNPVCAQIVAKNYDEKLILDPSSERACSSLRLNWQDIREFQAKEGKTLFTVDEKWIEDAMKAKADTIVHSMMKTDAMIYEISFLIYYFIAVLALLIIRWIVRGFKSS